MDNSLFYELRVCNKWGRRPSEFGLCKPEDDFMYMSAYTSAEELMSGYERDEAERKAALESSRANAKGKS